MTRQVADRPYADVNAEAGWYPDPYDSMLVRWFDGANWTDHTQPNPAVNPSPQQMPPQHMPPQGGPVGQAGPYDPYADAAQHQTQYAPQQFPQQPAPHVYQPQPGAYTNAGGPLDQGSFAVNTRTGQWDTIGTGGRLTPPDHYEMRPLKKRAKVSRQTMFIGAGVVVGLIIFVVVATNGGPATTPNPGATPTSVVATEDFNSYRAPDATYSINIPAGWSVTGDHRWNAGRPNVDLAISVSDAGGVTLEQATTQTLDAVSKRAGFQLVSNSGITLRSGPARLLVIEEGEVVTATKEPTGENSPTTAAPRPLKRIRTALTISIVEGKLVVVTFSAPAESYLSEWARGQTIVITTRVPAGPVPTETTAAPPTSTAPSPIPPSSTP